MNLSLFSELQLKKKQKCCLGLPGYLQKVKKSADLLVNQSVVKFFGRSKKFACLASDINIFVVLENGNNFKKVAQ